MMVQPPQAHNHGKYVVMEEISLHMLSLSLFLINAADFTAQDMDK